MDVWTLLNIRWNKPIVSVIGWASCRIIPFCCDLIFCCVPLQLFKMWCEHLCDWFCVLKTRTDGMMSMMVGWDLWQPVRHQFKTQITAFAFRVVTMEKNTWHFFLSFFLYEQLNLCLTTLCILSLSRFFGAGKIESVQKNEKIFCNEL